MTTTYTPNFSFPLLGTGSESYDATFNAMLEKMDLLMAEARNPLTWEDDGSDYLLDGLSSTKPTTEVLTYDGDVLLWA